MNIHLTPEQQRIVDDALKSGYFQSAEEVIAQALVAFREKERPALLRSSDNRHDDAVREMLNFIKENRTPLRGVSVKQLIHEGHCL